MVSPLISPDKMKTENFKALENSGTKYKVFKVLLEIIKNWRRWGVLVFIFTSETDTKCYYIYIYIY